MKPFKQELINFSVSWPVGYPASVDIKIRLTNPETGKKYIMIGTDLKGEVVIVDEKKK